MAVSRRRARILVTAVLVGVSVACQGAVIAASAASTQAFGRPAWHKVAGARLAPNNVLNGIGAVSRQLAWAVGIEGFSSDGKVPGRPVMERWSGRLWSVVRLPSSWPGGLGFVAASSARDAWALGQESSGMREHLLHWSGRRWREVAFPGRQGTLFANLGLSAARDGPAWLIGSPAGSSDTFGWNGSRSRPPGYLCAAVYCSHRIGSSAASSDIFGWNGSRWRLQPYRCAAVFCNLDQTSARTASDAWAVGNYVTGTGSGGPLALHWTGRAWHPTAIPAIKFGYLTGVVALSRTDAWAVGVVFNTSRMLLFRWNGTAWHQVSTPAGLTVPGLGEQTGITSDSAGQLWIYDFGPQTGQGASYLRYDGHRWSMLHGPVINGQTRVIVRDVAAVPGTTIAWSVGLGFTPPIQARARIERYS
jgi:hypothetical protein